MQKKLNLIDADELEGHIKILGIWDEVENKDVFTNDIKDAILKLIDAQPTAYDPDKVVEQLENERKFWENAYDSNLGKEKARSYEHAIEIVKGCGIDG